MNGIYVNTIGRERSVAKWLRWLKWLKWLTWLTWLTWLRWNDIFSNVQINKSNVEHKFNVRSVLQKWSKYQIINTIIKVLILDFDESVAYNLMSNRIDLNLNLSLDLNLWQFGFLAELTIEQWMGLRSEFIDSDRTHFADPSLTTIVTTIVRLVVIVKKCTIE